MLNLGVAVMYKKSLNYFSGVKNVNIWPTVDGKLELGEKIKIAIQINGKTREIIEIEKDLDEKDVIIESKKSNKINDQLTKNKIQKIIYVKNRIINYLIN